MLRNPQLLTAAPRPPSLNVRARTSVALSWVRSQISNGPPWRRYSAAAAHVDADRLPLAGIRVLDMTRVLAGVGNCLPRKMAFRGLEREFYFRNMRLSFSSCLLFCLRN